MKANVFFKTVCVMVAMVASVSMVNAQNGYVTNDVMEGEKIVGRIIYKNEGGLQHHLKSDFTYDDQNRIATKETFLWNQKKQEWVPQKYIQYSYTDTEIRVSSSNWNKFRKAYTDNVKRANYDISRVGLQVAQLSSK